MDGHAKTSQVVCDEKWFIGICAEGSAGMLKQTHSLLRLGGVVVGTCCMAKGFMLCTWILSCLWPVRSVKKRILRLTTV